MDFKSILSKLDSMDAPVATPAAPTIAKAVQLNEDAQLRVLAGQTTYVAEAKKKKDEEKKEEKVDEATKTDKPWTDMSGKKHPGTAVKGDKYTGKEAEKEEKSDKKSKKDESVEPEFKSKFMKMVEAKKDEADKKKADKKKKMEEGAKPDFLDIDKDGDKKEPMKKAVADKKKNPFAKKDDDVKEAAEKTATTWTDMKGNKHPATKVKGDKYTGKEAEKEDKKSKKDESAMMPKGKKRPVKESVEQKLTFREMMTLVIESGGQQQIDAVNQELFAWAQRVAKQKLGEGMKAEVYAGMVYERMGGVFEMYDVLAEDQN